jgi:hypothetical protein
MDSILKKIIFIQKLYYITTKKYEKNGMENFKIR